MKVTTLRPFFAATLLGLAACAGVDEQTPDQLGSASQDLREKICPAIAILCIEGYTARQVGGCNWICVPDRGAWQCSADIDCPSINCITTPCPGYECRGHKCVLNTNGSAPAESCGNSTCGQGSYCCDPYCGTCAPDGYACIQGCPSGTPL